MIKSSTAKSTPGTSDQQAKGATKKKLEKTELENKKFDVALKVFKLIDPPESFEESRYQRIKNLVWRLAPGPRSVKMVNDLLKVIFCP